MLSPLQNPAPSCHGTKGPCHLSRRHRIISVEQLTGKIKKPKSFDVDQYIHAGHIQFGKGKTLKLKADVVEWLARILRKTPLSEDQKLVENGEGYLLTASVADSWQLRWWILSQGPFIKVLSPKHLLDEIREP